MIYFRKIFLAVCLSVLSFSVFCQKYTADQIQGFESFRKGDWTSAMFFLRKAGASLTGYDDETMYMLVMSEMNAGEYSSALADANLFIQKFPSSHYAPYMLFQKGRALHFLDKNEDAVLVLSDFCHQNQDSELYPSALYWIAECFYAEYNFDSARALYERVVADFPSDSKVTDSRYRIEMIAQREREEKLVYLLKVTGEENLAAREDYERQIKLFQTQDKLGLRKNLSDAQARIAELEAELENERKLNEELNALNSSLEAQKEAAAQEKLKDTKKQTEVTTSAEVKPADEVSFVDPEVEVLKKKAKYLQYLLDEQRSVEK